MRGHVRRTLSVALAAVTVSLACGTAGAGTVLSHATEKPLVVLRVSNPAEARDALADTRIGQQMSGSPFLSSLFAMERDCVLFCAAFLADLTPESIERLLGREMAFVVFVPAGGEPAAVLGVDLGHDAAMIRKALKERFIPRLRALDPSLSIVLEQVDGTALVAFEVEEKTSYLRLVDNLLLFGTKAGVMKFSPRGAELAASARVEQGLASLYVDLRPVWDRFRRAAGEGPGKAVKLRGSGLPAIRDLRAVTRVVDGGFKDTVTLSLDGDASGVLAALLPFEPGRMRAAEVIPDDYSLLASWWIGSGEKLYALLTDLARIKGGEAGVQSLQQQADALEATFGLSVQRDLLPALGGEVFLALRMPDVETLRTLGPDRPENYSPIFGLAVRNPDALLDLVERVVKSAPGVQQGWELVRPGGQDDKLYRLRSAAQGKQLAFAFEDGFMVCSPFPDAVRDAVTAAQERRTLDQDEQYRAIRAHLPRRANAQLYVDIRPARELAMALGAARMARRARAFLPLISQSVPQLGGYALAAVSEKDSLRLEGYGDVPALFALTNIGVAGLAQKLSEAKAGAD